MTKTAVLFVFLISSISFAQDELQIVDIGFRDFDKHIAIELTTQDGVDALKFSFASNATGKAVPISNCAYSQKSLEREVDSIGDPKVKADFNWIFFRSDYSKSPINQFYPEFKSLLERANPGCPIETLQQLKDRLDSLKG